MINTGKINFTDQDPLEMIFKRTKITRKR